MGNFNSTIHDDANQHWARKVLSPRNARRPKRELEAALKRAMIRRDHPELSIGLSEVSANRPTANNALTFKLDYSSGAEQNKYGM